jgi:S-DNA-T family DNA segregation ATPase FtsK/SpoIIIE
MGMVKDKYKIVINGKNIYSEYALPDGDDSIVKIGTTKNCQVRFNKDHFFDEFEFYLSKKDSGWQLNCDKGVYFTTDGVMKIYYKDMSHGDMVWVKYQNFDGEIFKLNFFIDFDADEKNYERVIDISNINEISIGGLDGCDIVLKDELIGNDTVTLKAIDGEYHIIDNKTRYGVYINGKKASDRTKLNNYDFFMIVGYSFYFKDKRLYTSKYGNIRINSLNYTDTTEQLSALKYPKFNRNTRVKYVIPEKGIEILPPKPKSAPPKKNLILTLVPVLAMIALTVILRGIMKGGSGFTFVIYSVASMTLGLVMSIVSMVMDKKQYEKDMQQRKEKYFEYIGKKEEEINKFREIEWKIAQQIYKPLDINIQTVSDFSGDLYDRDIKDEDFLFVRVGTGVCEANCKVVYTKQEYKDTDDELLNIPEDMEEKYRYIANYPIVSMFSNSNAIGIVGERSKLYGILKNITIDVCIRHFYKDVKLFYMFSENDCDRFAWLRWLTHVNNDDIGVRNLIYDEESRNTILEYLYKQLTSRESELNSSGNASFNTFFVIFVFDSKGIGKHPISKYIESCNKYGFTFVFFEDHEEFLPKGCTEIIRLDTDSSGGLIITENGYNISKFNYLPVSDRTAEEVALKLGSVYVDEVNLESELTKNISLFELLDIMTINDLDLSARWGRSQVYKSMAAPLGVKTKNQTVYLDLHEKKHGPHGLVAGTTGSGKSEILQTYVLSIASLFHPYEVGFVIIDFKGGGMANQFKDLPHLMGAITNIEGREIDRSLMSIKAELIKRQAIFKEYNVNHIDSYIKLYKENKAKHPLPHLIIIVDEFAELKSECPDFMKELISAARIGRSLGVHLILATQKPSGVVDNQIWSNSKFKLCLKVQTKEDSNEVIRTPLAAEIVEPGRAYLQVGNNEIFELFQSAYSGAKADNSSIVTGNVFELYKLNLWGKRQLIYSNKKKSDDKNADTQLNVLVNYIKNYCMANSISRLPGICLPPLPEIIEFNDIKQPANDVIDTKVAIGMYDDPSNQVQDTVVLNISESHTLIVGSSQYGKTNLIQTIIRGIMQNYTPDEVNIYILDFGSKILKNFSGLNHVGGVVTLSEDEKIKNFIRLIKTEIAFRKDKLLNAGISSFASYREAGHRDIPHIVVIIDNFIGFKENYTEYDDDMLGICREGIAVGISIILSNLQTGGIGYKYLSNFANRIALYCNDSGEYGNVFDRCRMQPKDVPGRALISVDRRIFECQCSLSFNGEKEVDRVENMKKFIEVTNSKEENRNKKARVIPEIPRLLTEEYIKYNYAKTQLKKYQIPIGLDYDEVDLVTLDLLKLSVIAVTGRENSGRTNFLKIIMNHIQKNIFDHPVKAYIIDDVERHLKKMDDYGFVDKYTVDANEFEVIIDEIDSELENRQEVVTEEGIEGIEKEPLLLVIVQNRDAIGALSSNKKAVEVYKKITRQYKALKVCFIFSDIENAAVAYGSPEILKSIKENKKALIFDDINNNKVFDIPVNALRTFKKPIEKGDAYFVMDNELIKIKTIFQE